MSWPRPSVEDIRAALAPLRPDLADADIAYVDQGWDFWAFSAGPLLVRSPINDWYAGRLEREQALMQRLAPTLPLPVPVPSLYIADGPNGLPLSGYERIPGVSLYRLGRSPAPGFGAALGRFLSALHAFPPGEALGLGFELVNGPRLRTAGGDRYEAAVRKVFPLLSCETRSYVSSVQEAYLGDPANFEFEPCLCHGDIDDRNVLGDPASGELSGLVDFLDADVGPAAGDFAWAYCGGFERLGIAAQLPDLLREGGIDERQLLPLAPYIPVRFALDDIVHGLEIGEEDLVRDGLERLNRLVPRELQCS